jgi:hypothetical protein
MKRGHIVLASGAIMLVAGIVISAIWGVSFAGSFLRENTIVAKTIIDAGKSVEAKTNVNQLDRPVSLAIGIDRSGQQQTFSDMRLKETVTDPDGKVVNSNEFGGSFFTSFSPQVAGVYTVTISNIGTKPVSVSGAFGYMSFMGPDGKPNIGAVTGEGELGMIIAGGGLAMAGIITLIVGAIVTAIDSRASKQSGATTTRENGITYRKD